MDFWSTSQIALFLAIAALPITLILWRGSPSLTIAVGIASAVFVLLTPIVFDRLYEKLQFKDVYAGQRFARLVENRHGVIAVSDSSVTFGGGMYDGQIAIDLANDRNAIARAFAGLTLHPRPARVFMVGMSTGAWAQVVASSNAVDSVMIIEINPGYLHLISQYPQVASLLRNPKVRVVVDDGRRWLVHHPSEKFDFIVSNTTFHYRANVTNLLSHEFMSLVRKHLKPGGVFYYNTTGSQDAYKTGFEMFPYGMRVYNFAAVSDSPISLDSTRWHNALMSWKIDGVPVVQDPATLEKLLDLPGSLHGTPKGTGLETRESVLARIPEARVVTDDNMLTEWHRLLLPFPKRDDGNAGR